MALTFTPVAFLSNVVWALPIVQMMGWETMETFKEELSETFEQDVIDNELILDATDAEFDVPYPKHGDPLVVVDGASLLSIYGSPAGTSWNTNDIVVFHRPSDNTHWIYAEDDFGC